MSNAANNEFGLSFGDDLVKMRSRFISYFSFHRTVVSERPYFAIMQLYIENNDSCLS